MKTRFWIKEIRPYGCPAYLACIFPTNGPRRNRALWESEQLGSRDQADALEEEFNDRGILVELNSEKGCSYRLGPDHRVTEVTVSRDFHAIGSAEIKAYLERGFSATHAMAACLAYKHPIPSREEEFMVG